MYLEQGPHALGLSRAQMQLPACCQVAGLRPRAGLPGLGVGLPRRMAWGGERFRLCRAVELMETMRAETVLPHLLPRSPVQSPSELLTNMMALPM